MTRGMVTPQMKGIGVNDRFGNTSIRKQQGTSREIFDSILVTQAERQQGFTIRFFEDVQSRSFPLTNLDNTNQLTVGETLITENYYIARANVVEGVTEKFGVLDEFEKQGILSFELANSITIQRIPTLSSVGEFNVNGQFENYGVYNFYTQVVIPPLLNFVFIFRVPPNASASGDTLYRFNVAGVGSLIAPRTTF
ncbi:MAG: hypothetical protein CBD16_09080 [Betaproteobacteria bacterium TMED156]|nr:MAG: hypothetical protein CBD16_09080 [Betaproteobacteria bacterium TMED156]